MSTPEAQSKLIEQLGGGTEIATWMVTALGVPPSGKVVGQWRERAYKWKEHGHVPWRWRPLVVSMAVQKGVAVPAGFMGPQAALESPQKNPALPDEGQTPPQSAEQTEISRDHSRVGIRPEADGPAGIGITPEGEAAA